MDIFVSSITSDEYHPLYFPNLGGKRVTLKKKREREVFHAFQ